MGQLQPAYAKAIFDDLISVIESNSAHYYAFASNPVPFTGNTIPTLTADDYTDQFTNDWQLLFGQLLSEDDILPVVNSNIWNSGSVYSRYDNTSQTLFANLDYYITTLPSVPGASYNVYKCIDNANGAQSTVQPVQVQQSSFI